MVTDSLAQAYELFLLDANEASLLSAILTNGELGLPPELDYPMAHRIRDLIVCGDWYRVVRLYNPDDRSCRLYIYPTDTPGEQLGVPYELSGESLHQWVMDELDESTDGQTDWSRYL